MVRYLSCLFFFLILTFSGYAQEISTLSKQMNKIVPNYKQDSDADNTNNQAPLLTNFSRGDLFPKTQIDTKQSIIFRSNNFDVQKAFKQNKKVGFQPEAMKGEGINESFIRQSKKKDDKENMKQFKKFLYKQNNQ